MSRIRGIEVKVQKEVLQTRKYGLNEILKNKTEDQADAKDVEKQQIDELLHKLPKLNKIFEVHHKIGEGTFSSVYLGSLRQHADLPASEKRWFAIKHLVPTAHPARIEHELRCLQDIGGKENVIGVDICLRHLDTIVFVMPYIPHKKFSEYVGEMDAEELRSYMRALLTALRHVHSFGVIHRDVKPSNFLYDRENKRYLLVDFGLAQRICLSEGPGKALPPPAHSNNSRKRTRGMHDDTGPGGKRMALDLSVGSRKGTTLTAVQHIHLPAVPRVNLPKCGCVGVGGVCGACLSRGGARAPRAGTQGFRPPEVLLKVGAQGTAVDAWAAGVVLASALCARYPFFRAADDVAALAELADLLGTDALAKAAHHMGRNIVVSSSRPGLCLRKLCAELRGARVAGDSLIAGDGCRLPLPDRLYRPDGVKAEEFDGESSTAGFPDSAFALCARLLDPNPATRISAAEALQHPFLRDQC